MTLPAEWRTVENDEARGLIAELRRELPSGHDLFGLELEAIARHETTDDVLFRQVPDDGPRFWVHLTWNVESDPAWPHTVVCHGEEAFLERWVEEHA